MPDAPIYTPIDRKLRLDTRLFFGVGQIAEGLKNLSIGYFALFYYNHVFGLSGGLTGLVLSIALVIDALTDPMKGSLSDNFRSRGAGGIRSWSGVRSLSPSLSSHSSLRRRGCPTARTSLGSSRPRSSRG